MSKQKREFRVGVGASSILMVLVVLALTALSLLSFSGARSAEVLAKRNVMMATAFYQATAEVQQNLAVLDETLSEQSGVFEPAQASAIADQMREKGLLDFSLEDQGQETIFSFSVDAGYSRIIKVTGRILPQGNPRYQVIQHELVSLPMEDEEQYYTLMGE